MDLNTWLAAEKGRAAALAKHLGRSPAAISQWRVNGVPVDLMKAVREFTGGEVTLEEMVPDMAPPVVSTLASVAPAAPAEPRAEHAQACDIGGAVVVAARALEHDGDDLAPAPAVLERRHPESAHEWIAPKRRDSDKPRA
jgi:DNA-binding transcriptional regulator YdaS (Cro superfamily)